MEGIAWYAYEILSRITRNNPDVEFLFLFDRDFSNEFIFSENVRGIKVGPQARHPILYKWWFDYSLPKILNKEKIDLFFSPEGYIPLRGNTAAVNVIHDLGFEHFNDHMKASELKYYRKKFPQFANRAKEIITVSNYSKNDICELYKIDSNKVNVVYNGVRESLRSTQRTKSDEDYFIYVGTLHPRKNIVKMIQAFDTFVSQTGRKVTLKIAGRAMGKSNEINNCLQGIRNKHAIHLLGYQSDDQLTQLLAGAKAMVYIPLFEGFGLPVLEAFQNNLPLICANNSSLPEVADDAALMVDANSIEEIVKAMAIVFDKPEYIQKMLVKGKQQVAQFSWDKAAKETWQILKRNCG